MGPTVFADTSCHNYRSALRNTPEARRSSVDIPLPVDDNQNDVFPRISSRYYQHTDLIKDTTACLKILAHRQDRVIPKSTSLISTLEGVSHSTLLDFRKGILKVHKSRLFSLL